MSIGRPRERRQIATRNFAGRIGGNQGFIDDVDNTDNEKFQDAEPLPSIRTAFSLNEFRQPELYRLAALEGFGSTLLVFTLGSLQTGVQTTTWSLATQVCVSAICGALALALFTYALAPITGAHLTPVITITTHFIGLTTVPRAVLYISAQILGAIVAGYWLKLGLGSAYFASGFIPGCTGTPGVVSPGQVFVMEFAFDFMVIFLACGLGLDPRQRGIIGPILAPALVGLSLGLGVITSAYALPGWAGISFNPARCLGLSAPLGTYYAHYILWLAPLAAAALNGVLYQIMPPWEKRRR